MMVEVACGATVSLVYEKLLKKAIPNLTENSIVVLIICGGQLLFLHCLLTGSSVSIESLTALREKYAGS
jgi:hypothetical protein